MWEMGQCHQGSSPLDWFAHSECGMQPNRVLWCGCTVNDEEIFRKHRVDLVNYAAALAGPANAEDLVSAVVLRVLSRRTLASLDDPRPYLFRAVLNESRSFLARRPRHGLQFDQGVVDAESPSFEVLAAVQRLSPQQRAATYLIYWADLSIRETALLMGVRSGTVKRYLFLARRNLKGVLGAN